MNTRLQEIIKYKTGGRQNAFAELLNWSPQYLSKLLKGVNLGLQPVVSIIDALPEINARWFLTGKGEMLSNDKQIELRREVFEQTLQIIELERFIPIMTGEELKQFESLLKGRSNIDFSPDTLKSMQDRLNTRESNLNERITDAINKSDKLCKQKKANK